MYGLNNGANLADEKEWNKYLQNTRANAARKKQAEDLAIELGETSYSWAGPTSSGYGIVDINKQNKGAATSNSSTNQFGGDWTSGNGNFSFDNMKTMAKDLSQQQIDHSRQMMELSAGFRTAEKNLDTGIRQREADQKFGFEKSLQELSQNWQGQMQDSRFNQDRTMFDKSENQDIQKTRSARSAANSLYYGANRF